MVEQIVEIKGLLRDVLKAQAETRLRLDHCMKKVAGGPKAIPEIPAEITFPLNSVAEVDALEGMFVDLTLQECIVSET